MLADLPLPAAPATRLEKLTAADFGTLLLWICLGAIGATVAYRYYFKAFPEASVDFKVSRAQALELGQKFVVAQHANLAGYQSTIVFDVDETAKTYLERTVGLEQANHLMATDVNTWSWNVRFFKPQQKEEFQVHISPQGRVVFYNHVIEEAQKGARLDAAHALVVAALFLRDQYHPANGTYDMLPEESSASDRPNRLDWGFTWQRRNFNVPQGPNGAPYQIHIDVQGDAVGGVNEFLKIPEQWKRDYSRMRSANDLLESFALFPYFILYGAAFWLIYELSRRGLLRWGPPVKLGLFLAFLYCAYTLNNWPSIRSGYDTNSSYSSFVFEQVAIAAALSLAQGLLVTFALAPGEPIYRASQPDKLQLAAVVKKPGMRSKEFFRAMVIGICLAAVHLGYIVVFYIVGRRFGVWAPQDLKYSNSISTLFPWLEALTVGLYAATSEEFLFRMFAIPFMQRVTKSRVMAVVLPAFAWGFLHVNYPQEPPYIRGVEIGIIGIVAGIVMLRWGILATLTWHYTVDAVLGSLLLLRTPNPYLRISGAIVGGAAFIPLIITGVLYLVRGGFVVDESVLNRARPVETPAEPETTAVAAGATEGATHVPVRTVHQALSRSAILLTIVCGLVGAGLLIGVHPKQIGNYVRFQIDSREAISRADNVLRSWHVDPSRYHKAAIVVAPFNPLVNEFLREKLGIEAANKIYQQQVPQVFWRVRYFRDSEQDEYAVLLQTDGSLHSVWHTLDSKAAGPNLTKEQAGAIAEKWLVDYKRIDPAQWRLVDAASTKQPHRTDHGFTWENLKPLAGGPNADDAAFQRIELHVQGDEPSTYRTFVKIPERWSDERIRETQSLGATLLGYWSVGLPLILGIVLLVIFFRNIKQAYAESVPWRRLAGWGLVAAAAFTIVSITNVPTALANYRTAIPYRAFLLTIGIGWVIFFACVVGAIALAFALGWFLWSKAGKGDSLPGWSGMPAAYYRDALVIGVFATLAWLGVSRMDYLISTAWKTRNVLWDAVQPSGLDANSPALQAIAHSVMRGIVYSAMVAALTGLIAVYIRPTWLRLALLVGAALTYVSDPGSAADFARQFLIGLIAVTIIWWAIVRVLRFNLLGYFLIFASLTLLGAGSELYIQPNSVLRRAGVVSFAALAVMLLWPLVAWRRSGTAAIPIVPATPSSTPPTA